jgi:hypothetical protein
LVAFGGAIVLGADMAPVDDHVLLLVRKNGER